MKRLYIKHCGLYLHYFQIFNVKLKTIEEMFCEMISKTINS